MLKGFLTSWGPLGGPRRKVLGATCFFAQSSKSPKILTLKPCHSGLRAYSITVWDVEGAPSVDTLGLGFRGNPLLGFRGS